VNWRGSDNAATANRLIPFSVAFAAIPLRTSDLLSASVCSLEWRFTSEQVQNLIEIFPGKLPFLIGFHAYFIFERNGSAAQ
jgi:hypothetical protein